MFLRGIAYGLLIGAVVAKFVLYFKAEFMRQKGKGDLFSVYPDLANLLVAQANGLVRGFLLTFYLIGNLLVFYQFGLDIKNISCYGLFFVLILGVAEMVPKKVFNIGHTV